MLDLLQQLRSEEGVALAGVSWTVILSACSHCSLVDEGLEIFRHMKESGLLPGPHHYGCLVDLLARAGRLEEAEGMATGLLGILSTDDALVLLKTVLGACRTSQDIERAERVYRCILSKAPGDPSAMILMGNTYAAAGMLDEAKAIRERMKREGIRKTPGMSWIEVDGQLRAFRVNDWSHPDARRIHEMCNTVLATIKARGYKPDTSWVLQEMVEDEKVEAQREDGHQFRIAEDEAGYPPHSGKQSAHSATKLIAAAFDRDIFVVRDTRLFHHFHPSTGMCSCGDKY